MNCNINLCVFLGNCCEKVVQPPKGRRPTGWEPLALKSPPLAVSALSLDWHSAFFTWLACCVHGASPAISSPSSWTRSPSLVLFFFLQPSSLPCLNSRDCLLAVSSLCFLFNFDKFGTNFLLDGMHTSVWLSDCLSGQGLTMEPWLAGAHNLPLPQECWD